MVYIRKYELTIGAPPHTFAVHTPEDEIVAGKPKDKTGDKDFRTAPQDVEARTISSLHMTAQVVYSTNKTASNNQPATITLYNLSPNTQKFIKTDGIVFLKAGYDVGESFEEEDEREGDRVRQERSTDLPLIFTGQIEYVSTEKHGQDSVTTIECKDLGFDQKVVRVSDSFEPGTTYESILESLLKNASNSGMPTGYFLKEPIGKLRNKTNAGFTLEGNLVEELNNLCSDIGYKAYISLGKIYVEPSGARERGETVILKPINIKGYIRREESNEGSGTKSDNNVNGIKVETFLNGGISTNKMLKIEEGENAGLYKITDVVHSLEYEGDSWSTEITATELV